MWQHWGIPDTPDLAPAEFYLLSRLKSRNEGTALLLCQWLIKNATQELKRISQNGLQECFQHLYSRWQKCLFAQVDYSKSNVAKSFVLFFIYRKYRDSRNIFKLPCKSTLYGKRCLCVYDSVYKSHKIIRKYVGPLNFGMIIRYAVPSITTISPWQRCRPTVLLSVGIISQNLSPVGAGVLHLRSASLTHKIKYTGKREYLPPRF
jgi:hypothetical protein